MEYELIGHAQRKLGGRLDVGTSHPRTIVNVSRDLTGRVVMSDGLSQLDILRNVRKPLIKPIVREAAIQYAMPLLGRSVSVSDPISTGTPANPDKYTAGTPLYRGFVTRVRAWMDGYVDVYVRPDSDRSTGDWVDVALVRQLERD